MKIEKGTVTFIFFIIMFSSIIFEEYIIIPGIGSVTRFVGFLFVIAAFFHLLYTQKFIKGNSLPHMYVYVILIISVLWAPYKALSYNYLFTYFQYIILGFLMVQILTNNRILYSLYFYSLTSLIISLGLIYGIDSGDFNNRATLLGLDPNELALLLNLGLASTIYSIQKKTLIDFPSGIGKFLMVLFALVFFLSIMSTGSRTGLVCYIINLVYFTHALGFKGKHIVVGILIIGLLSYSIFPYLVNWIDSSTISRILEIDEQIKEKNFTGRGFIWEKSILLFSKKPIMGYGVGNSEYFLAAFFPGFDVKSTHNIFLQILLEVGILGFLFFLYSILVYFKRVLKLHNNTDKSFWIIILILLLVGGLTLAIFKKKYYLIFFTFGLIYKNFDEKIDVRNFLRK